MILDSFLRTFRRVMARKATFEWKHEFTVTSNVFRCVRRITRSRRMFADSEQRTLLLKTLPKMRLIGSDPKSRPVPHGGQSDCLIWTWERNPCLDVLDIYLDIKQIHEVSSSNEAPWKPFDILCCQKQCPWAKSDPVFESISPHLTMACFTQTRTPRAVRKPFVLRVDRCIK